MLPIEKPQAANDLSCEDAFACAPPKIRLRQAGLTHRVVNRDVSCGPGFPGLAPSIQSIMTPSSASLAPSLFEKCIPLLRIFNMGLIH
jgi:hypothetical protein